MISFEPLNALHLPLLHEWIQRPHVAEWWEAPRSMEDIEHEYQPIANGKSTTRAFLALLNDEPIGFIQSYVVMASGDGWWEDENDPGARGIDQFLANANQLNQGLGTLMVKAFVEQLFGDPAVTKVQTDPSPNNQRAIRCYRKAGFVERGEVRTPDGTALLMVRRRRPDCGIAHR
jgi:RimJ/RimL family protein N-acetyltransferase